MKKWAYYNEHDKFAAEWIRQLMRDGLIMEGEVDERSIEDVLPSEVDGFIRCHWFAGIAGWDYALRLAGWPDNKPVWTGSCPCQPFSTSGKGKGVNDERHLWPAFYHLISQRKPPVVFGEQVASISGRQWFAGVQADMEASGYRCAGANLCAAGESKPHLRQRLFWTADTYSKLYFGKDMPGNRWPGAGAAIRRAAKDQQKRYRRFDELFAMGIGERANSYTEARAVLYGLPNVMDLLRGAGNAICPEVGATFIKAYLASAQGCGA